jgi:hypothetical protein
MVLTLSLKSHTPTIQNWPKLAICFPKKEGLIFPLIHHLAHRISRGGSNQREPLSSLCSPSHHASLGISFCGLAAWLRHSTNPAATAGGAQSG